jgi:hypothetical protein
MLGSAQDELGLLAPVISTKWAPWVSRSRAAEASSGARVLAP